MKTFRTRFSDFGRGYKTLEITYDETMWDFKRNNNGSWSTYLFGAKIGDDYSTKYVAMMWAKRHYAADMTINVIE